MRTRWMRSSSLGTAILWSRAWRPTGCCTWRRGNGKLREPRGARSKAAARARCCASCCGRGPSRSRSPSRDCVSAASRRSPKPRSATCYPSRTASAAARTRLAVGSAAPEAVAPVVELAQGGGHPPAETGLHHFELALQLQRPSIALEPVGNRLTDGRGGLRFGPPRALLPVAADEADIGHPAVPLLG